MGWQPSRRRRRLPPTQPCALGTCPTPQSPSRSLLCIFLRNLHRMPCACAAVACHFPPSSLSPLFHLSPAALSIFSPSHIRVIKSLSSVAALAAVKIPKRQRPKGVAPPRPLRPLLSPAALLPFCENIFPSIFLLAQQFPSAR